MKSEKGFTLLELLITMAIMGILTVSVVNLYGAISKLEKERATKKEMEEIKKSIVNYYQKNLVLPLPDSNYILSIDELELPPSAQTDENYKDKYYVYVATNQADPFADLKVDGKTIGTTASVLISSGRNLRFEEENSTLSDGIYTQKSSNTDFDDILIYISQSELETSISWRREIEEELAVLNQAAQILAENDDDNDGFVDEDTTDPSGNWDGLTNWNLVSGVSSLTNAGLVRDANKVVDPWGIEYIWDATQHKFYSSGPNKEDEWGMGDDIDL
ncbi:MAG: type II secretion system GspH family protein [candidate division Zixibacteria bacterium]|nr:type II secretion system GspH family protein [candidate division Zixibacteria bacterium]